MKKHHLDNIIFKLKKYLAGDEIEISLPEMLLIAFEEIKMTDETLQNLSDEIRGYDP